MMKLVAILFSIMLAGCSELGETLNVVLNTTTDELQGNYTAPTLAGFPRPSGCRSQRCKTLDAVEAQGYKYAREKKITWVNLVDVFYQERAKLYPNSQDNNGANEIRSYQRALAEQMDIGKLTESQWSYLIEKKTSDIDARNQALSNSAPRQTNCTTTNVGTSTFPEYKTTCD